MSRTLYKMLLGMVALPVVTVIYLLALVVVLVVDRLAPPPAKKVAKRKALKVELEEYFLPELQAAGFEGPSVFKGLDDFFHFRRRQGDAYAFLLIQFDKYKGPKFRISFSTDDQAGVTERLRSMAEFRGPVTWEDLDLIGGKRGGILGPNQVPFLPWSLWFNANQPVCRIRGWIQRVPPGELVAKKLARLYRAELEPFWQDGHVRPHLHLVDWSGRSMGPLERKIDFVLTGLYHLYAVMMMCLVTVLTAEFLVAKPLLFLGRLVLGVFGK